MSHVRECPVNRHSRVRACLELLADEGAVAQGEIKQRLNLPYSYIGKFITDLEKQGYVRRAVMITAKGREILALAEDAYGPFKREESKEVAFLRVVAADESEAAMEMMRQVLGD